MLTIGLDKEYFNFNENRLIREKKLVTTISDFKFLNNKKELAELEEKFSDKVGKKDIETGSDIDENKNSFLKNISFHRMSAKPFAPENNKFLGQDIVGVGSVTGENILSVLTKLTLQGSSGVEFGRTELTKAGFERNGVKAPVSDEKMMDFAENIKKWFAAGEMPDREITEDDLYYIGINGKLDTFESLMADKMEYQNSVAMKINNYEIMGTTLFSEKESDKKADYTV